MPGDGARTAVIIVNYKQEGYLPALFDSLASQSAGDFFTVLINSCHSNFTPPEGTHVVEMASNDGYAAALNRGIDWAMQRGVENVLLLNADIKLDSECLRNLLATDGDIVQPLILMMASPERINVAGLRPTSLGIAYCMGYKRPRSWAGEVAHDIPAASGAALLVRRRVFERIGLFDTAYFMYLEDVDFSLRARNAGFKVALNPKAVAWHAYHLRLGLRKILWLFRGSRRIRKLLRSKVS